MSFLPRDEKFFDLLQQQCAIAGEAARILWLAVRNGGDEAMAAAAAIRALESKGDGVLVQVFERLNKTFITPLDPEDIATLTNRLDDILDAIEEAAYRLSSYGLRPVPEAAVSLCELLDASVAEVCHAMQALARKQPVEPYWTRIEQIEDDADAISRQAVHDLFATERDAIRLIKAKEVVELLEEATDRCQQAADVIKTVFVKNC